MEHLVGYIIIGLSALSVLLAVLMGWQVWKRGRPHETILGVGIRYEKGAVRPWESLEACIRAIRQIVEEEFPDLEDVFMNFMIVVVPTDGYARGFMAPTGMLGGKKITGTIDRERFLGLFKTRWLVVVRQLDRTGTTEPAYSSALFHEVAEHLIPFRVSLDWNAGHAARWHVLTNKMERRAVELLNAG